MRVHELLANFLSYQALGQAHRALPAVALLGGARKTGAVELEVLGAHFLRQEGGAGAQDVPGGPQLPIGHAVSGKELFQVLQVGRHHIDHAVLRQLSTSEQGLGDGRQLRKFARVIGLYRIAGRNHVPVACRQFFFQADDALGGNFGAEAK